MLRINRQVSRSWPFRTLGEICRIVGGRPAPKGDQAFENGTIPFVRMKDLGLYHLTSNLKTVQAKLSAAYVTAHRLPIVPRGAILMPRSGSVALNHRAILGVDAVIVSHICALVVQDPNVDIYFLYHLLRETDLSNITKKTTGLDAITFSDLAAIKLAIPPLSIQTQIAAILERADAARQKRRAANQLTEQFLQSAYLEMFGDPVTNPKGWNKASLVDLCAENGDLRCGPFGSQLKKEHYQSEGVPVWDIEDVKAEFKNPPRFHISPGKATDLSNYCLQPGDIVVTRRATIGISAVYPLSVGRGVMHSALLRIRVDQRKADPVFLSNQLSKSKDVEDQISRFSTGAIFKSINVSKLKSVQILLPPLSEQLRYNVLVKNVESLRAKQSESEKELDNLFNSLMQRVFRGELVG